MMVGDGGVSEGGWCVADADWLMAGSHLGGLQDLDGLVGAIALVVFSSNHTVVGPNRKQDTQVSLSLVMRLR